MLNRSVFLCIPLVVAACSGAGDGSSQGSGGTTANGGAGTTGGAVTNGGAPTSGGSSAGGGATANGGTATNGGNSAAGTSAGGATLSTGGNSAAAGAQSSGGAQGSAMGGNATTGGASATGGRSSGGNAGASAVGGTSGGNNGTCSRSELQATVNAYLKALVAHDPTMAPLAASVRYTENTKEVTVGEGLWKTAGEVKLQRDLLDIVQCSTVSQVVLPESGADIVFTQRLKVEGGKITESEAVITRKGDWNFDAAGYLNTKSKTWDVLPAEQRTPRDTLITMPKVYWDYFKENEPPMPPFGEGCKRVEGGKGAPINCTAGIPSGVTISDRRFWADEEAGVSAGISIFGGTSGLLDVHYFRLVSGTIRDVYAMTVNTSYMGTGWPGGVP